MAQSLDKDGRSANRAFWPTVFSRSHQLAISIIIVTSVILLWSASRYHYLVCDMECGEAVIAKSQVDQLAAHGVQFGLIENENTFEDPDLYTHNVNIGDFFLIGLYKLGAHDYKTMAIIASIVHGIGLYYVYLTILLVSKSRLAALITLTVFATTYWGYGAFALNPLRAWHAVAFFMLTYHVTHWTMQTRLLAADFVGIIAGALIAFGCGYDFWVICAAASASLVISQGLKSRDPRRTALRFATLSAAFALPFFFRQLQIIHALSASYWWKDLVYSLAIKIPGASKFINIPSMQEIDEFYREMHVLRPPASPANSWMEIFWTAEHMVSTITVPRWGILSLSLLVIFVILALLSRLCLLPRSFRPCFEVQAVSSSFLLPVSIGISVGLAIFAPFSLHVYLKHEFPLIGFLVLVARGLFAYWLLTSVMLYRRRAGGYVAGAALLMTVIDAIVVHINASENSVYLNFGFLRFVEKHENARILISSYGPNPVSVYDEMVGLDRAGIQRRRPSEALETLQDIRDKIARKSDRLPEYWIYQQTEPHVTFDSPHPNCQWQDWLMAGANLFNPARFDKPTLDQPWLSPTSPGPGSIISFGGNLKGSTTTADVLSLELQPPLKVVSNPSYNCIYGSVVGWAAVTQPEDVTTTIKLMLQRPDGWKTDLHDYSVTIAQKSNPSLPLGPFTSGTEISVSALVEAAPDLRVVKWSSTGLGYVIFQIPQDAEN